MKKCMVILNPTSGKEKATHYEQLIVSQLHNYEVDVMVTGGEGDAKRFAQQACEKGYEAVVLVGGDGTLNEGINGIAGQANRPKVGIVPLGTVNDFARALGISLEPEEAIKLLGGKCRKADIGKVNDYYFTNIVAIGALSDAVGDASIEQKTALGPLAYLLEGVKAAVQNESFTIQVEANDETRKEEVMIFLCVLTNTVGSFETANDGADPSDGLLHCFIIRHTNILKLASIAKNLFLGKHTEDENIEKFNAREVFIQTDQPMDLNVDGDLLTSTPANISILHNHIEFFIGD